MNAPSNCTIKALKKELIIAIVRNNYNLLSPDIISLSKQLDDLMIPLFKSQLEETILLN
jgi:hypothetical protein